MLRDQPVARIEEQRRAVQRAAAALDHADHEACARALRQRGQLVGFGPRHVDRLRGIARVRVAALGQPVAEPRAEDLAFRIAAEHGLGQHDERRAAVADRGFVAEDRVERGARAGGRCADLQRGDD